MCTINLTMFKVYLLLPLWLHLGSMKGEAPVKPFVGKCAYFSNNI